MGNSISAVAIAGGGVPPSRGICLLEQTADQSARIEGYGPKAARGHAGSLASGIAEVDGVGSSCRDG